MRYEDRLLRVLTYIHDNPDGDLSLDQLADVAAMSRFHWHRVFHAMTGETCAQVVRRMRLHRAAGRLVREQTAVDEIAQNCGYPNPRSFAQAFRASYGVSPIAFRKAGQLDAPALLQRKGDIAMHPVEIHNHKPRRLIGLPHKGAYMTIGEKVLGACVTLVCTDLTDITSAGTAWDTWENVAGFDYGEQEGLGGESWPVWMSDDFTAAGEAPAEVPGGGPIYRWGNVEDCSTLGIDISDLIGVCRLEDGPTGPISKNVWGPDLQ